MIEIRDIVYRVIKASGYTWESMANRINELGLSDGRISGINLNKAVNGTHRYSRELAIRRIEIVCRLEPYSLLGLSEIKSGVHKLHGRLQEIDKVEEELKASGKIN